jgi:hypothetical protein
VKTPDQLQRHLFGLAEEERAGGALAFPIFNLGDRFTPDQVRIVTAGHRLTEVTEAGRGVYEVCMAKHHAAPSCAA